MWWYALIRGTAAASIWCVAGRPEWQGMRGPLPMGTEMCVSRVVNCSSLVTYRKIQQIFQCFAAIQSSALTQPSSATFKKKNCNQNLHFVARNVNSDTVMFHDHVRTWTVFRYPVYPQPQKPKKQKSFF